MIHLIPTPKNYCADQDKAVTPEETLTWVRARLAALPERILAETRRIDSGRLGIPVFLSICGADAKAVMPTRKQMGKGVTVPQAEASALMELMERYGFFTYWQNVPNGVQATWAEAEKLFAEQLLPVEEVVRACHDTITPDVARRVMNLRSWLFVPAMRIADEKECVVPLDLFRQLSEFNGSSAGNTDVESLFQGACELVERHVCSLADNRHPVLPTIDTTPGRMEDPVLEGLLKKFHANGISVLLKDFSLGLPAPTVAALAWDPATFPLRSEIVFTAGTASSPAKAAMRALTEVAQLAGDFSSGSCYEASGLPKYRSLEETKWLHAGPVVPLSSLPNLELQDILNELKVLAYGLAGQGYTLFAVSTTNATTRIPSHYSFVPGFHFRERDKNASLGLFTGRMICEHMEEKNAMEALAVLDSICPGAHFLPFFQGMVALRANRLARACSFFAHAEPLQPDDDTKALAAFYGAHIHSLKGEWHRALPGLTRAVSFCPGMKEYRNLLGVCLFKLGRYAEAAKEFAYILNHLDKGSAMDIQNLGLCHKFLGNHAQALHYLKTALSIDPYLAAARKHLDELTATTDMPNN